MKNKAHAARELMESRLFGSLATQSLRHEGFPFASIVEYALDDTGRPIFLMSRLAIHSKNLAANRKASLLVFSANAENDTLGSARVTLMGEMRAVPEDELDAVRARYLERHPGAEQWVDFGDFSFHRLEVADIYFVGGFGAMGWVSPGDYE